MIHDLALRWVVTLLFAVVVAECLHAIVTGRRSAAGVVGHSLHAIMAVAMAVMAWPWGATLPTTAPMLFFLAAAIWFTSVAFATAGYRGANGYHALMMLAMAWMYAAMGGLALRPAAPAMPGMDMSGHAGHGGHAGRGGDGGYGGGSEQYAWVGIMNWICAIGFAAAALYWLYRYFTARRSGDPGHGGRHGGRHWGLLCLALMALGTAIMFGVML